MKCIFLIFLFNFVVPPIIQAQPRFAAVFSDDMVLQREKPITIWGIDGKGRISVQLGEASQTATVDATGFWEATFPARRASDREVSLHLLQDGKVIDSIQHLLIGDVWLAAGQSNMQMKIKAMVKDLPETQTWVNQANYPMIRLRRVDDPVLEDRRQRANDWQAGNWIRQTPKTVSEFSAVASVFAKEIYDSIDIPIGIIEVSWGGKPIEPFIPRDQFTTPLLKTILDLSDREKLDELAQLEGGVIIRNPQGYPGAIYHARMAPVNRFPLRGFIWYQAESNAGRGEDPRHYREKMAAMAKGWRRDWADDSLPVYFVQLPSFAPANGWIRMREEQRLAALTIPHTGMAVTIDLPGENIHPPHKIEVGKRLARQALKKTYGKKSIIADGPVYKDAIFDKNRVRVVFDASECRLAVGSFGESFETQPGTIIDWFELAGDDQVWHPAIAKLGGNGTEVIVHSSQVAEPKAVRYGCAAMPQSRILYNEQGLPASPFCSMESWLKWQR